MKRLACSLAVLACLALGACNANPLLKAAASDYQPLRLGSAWGYASPDGVTTVTRVLSAAGLYNGLESFTLSSTVNGVPQALEYLAVEGGELKEFDSALGWIRLRRLPYVNGDKWKLPNSNPLLSQTMVVEGLEKVSVPAGEFEACFRLRSRSDTLDGSGNVLSSSDSLIWVAPGVGDVKYADLDAAGVQTVTLVLTSYSIPR